MKKLYISEKPDMTRKFLNLPLFQGGKMVRGSKPFYGYAEGDNWIHVWCLGHLAELFKPADYDSKYQKWNVEDLPILPENQLFKRKPKEEHREQIELIMKLMKREDVNTVVCCTDAEREGELIFRELYWMAQSQKPIQRLFVDATDDESLLMGFHNLEPGEKYDSLAAAADARDIMDLLIGDTLTRGYYCKLGQLLPLGRVMIALLAEIYQREETIRSFKSEPFYELFATFQNIEFKWKSDESQRITNRLHLEAVQNRLVENQGIVTAYEAKESKAYAPLLYNTTDITKECIREYHWSAVKTLEVLESLYLSPLSLITYPRTDSKHLPSSMIDDMRSTFSMLEQTAYASLVTGIDKDISKNKVFDDSKVSDHFAIVPNFRKKPNLNDLSEDQRKVYEKIVKRFIARFYPPAIYTYVQIEVQCADEIFQASSKSLLAQGYLMVLPDQGKEKEKFFPELKTGQTIPYQESRIHTGKTTPPPVYTEDLLLEFMETCGKKIEDEELSLAMRGKRLASPATEGASIQKLFDYHYIEQKGRSIQLTTTGRFLVEQVKIPELRSAEYTATMEMNLSKIRLNELKKETYLETIYSFCHYLASEIRQISDTVKDTLKLNQIEDTEIGKCPSCQKSVVPKKSRENKSFYACSGYPACKFIIPGEILQKKVPISQIKRILEKGSTEILPGFKNDKGKEFLGILYVEESQVKFRPPTQEELKVGECPQCSKDVIYRQSFFGCVGYPQCHFSLPVVLKEKVIPIQQIKKLLESGESGLIDGFKGEKGEFKAFLKLNNGIVSFRFPDKEDLSLGSCPICKQGHIIDKQSLYGCSFYPTCRFSIPKERFKKKIPLDQVKKLIQKGTTDIITGFLSEKEKTFQAILYLDNGYVKHRFPSEAEMSVGSCPKCKASVVDRGNSISCKSCDFKIFKEILGKKITAKQLESLLQLKMTETIKGFQGKKGMFDAKLFYSLKEAKITFIIDKNQ